MSVTKAVQQITEPNPLDFVPDEIPFDIPYGAPISLERAQAAINAAVAEAKKRSWKMNVAVADSGGNLVAFQRMDGAMLASIQIAEHKARAAATFRRPTKVFEDGINLMHLNYLLAFDGMIASRGGIPLIDQDGEETRSRCPSFVIQGSEAEHPALRIDVAGDKPALIRNVNGFPSCPRGQDRDAQDGGYHRRAIDRPSQNAFH